MIELVKCPAADDTKVFCSKGCEHYHSHEWTSECDDCSCCDATGCRSIKPQKEIETTKSRLEIYEDLYFQIYKDEVS